MRRAGVPAFANPTCSSVFEPVCERRTTHPAGADRTTTVRPRDAVARPSGPATVRPSDAVARPSGPHPARRGEGRRKLVKRDLASGAATAYHDVDTGGIGELDEVAGVRRTVAGQATGGSGRT